MKYPNRIKKEAASGQRISSLERSVMRLASMRAIAPKTQSTSSTQPKMDAIAQFFADAIKRVDPSVRLDEMSRDQVVKEGRDVIYLALETLQENIARHERADSTIAGDDRIVMVSLSTLAAYGIDASQLELYDSNPRMDTSSPTKRVMRWNGLRIGITHEANQDYRFGKKVGVSYGRLYGSYGDASDRRSHDFMIGDKLDNPKIHAIQQLTPEGMRDEVKYGIGFESPQEFKQAYQMQLPANLKEAMFGGVWEADASEFDQYREDLPGKFDARQGLVKKEITNRQGERQAVWVREGDPPKFPDKLKGKKQGDAYFSLDGKSVVKPVNTRFWGQEAAAYEETGGGREFAKRFPNSLVVSLSKWENQAAQMGKNTSSSATGSSFSSHHNAVARNSEGIISKAKEFVEQVYSKYNRQTRGDVVINPDGSVRDYKEIAKSTIRELRDRNGTLQSVGIVIESPDDLHFHIIASAPHNLSRKITESVDQSTLAGKGDRMPNRYPDSSASMLESVVVEAMSKGKPVTCKPLTKNIQLFERAGFKPVLQGGGGQMYIMDAEAQKRFMESRRSAAQRRDSSRYDSPEVLHVSPDWFMMDPREDSEQLILRMVGGVDRPPSPRNDSGDEDWDEWEDFEEDEGDRADADDEKDIADIITEKADRLLAKVFTDWSRSILETVKGAGNLQDAAKALEQGKGYEDLGDDKFISVLEQAMIASHLAGMDEASDETNLDSLIRMDAPRLPEWLKLSFKEAINAFKKKIAIPTASYRQMQEGYHDWAFSIAKMTKASMLNDAKWVIQKGMEDGTSYEAMIKQWNRLIGRQGWKAGENRIYTILDTNIRSAQASGRAQQMYDPDIINSRPYAVWRWGDSPNPRPHHQALHNKAIALENPFWDRCRNPAGWGCRCSTFSASKEFCDRNGIEILNNPPDPELIADVGFRFPLRGLSDENRREIIKQTLDTLPPALRKKVEGDVN